MRPHSTSVAADGKLLTRQGFNDTLSDREKKYGKFGWAPCSDPKELYPGTYHLEKVDEHGRRSYIRSPVSPSSVSINYGRQAFHARMPPARSFHTLVLRSPLAPACMLRAFGANSTYTAPANSKRHEKYLSQRCPQQQQQQQQHLASMCLPRARSQVVLAAAARRVAGLALTVLAR
jgi:hypothetical protein